MISELEATHCPYAQITAGDKEGEDAPRGELHTLEQQVINFFNSRDIPEDSQNVAVCYVKPRSRVNKSNRSMIVIRFVSRKHKNEVLKQDKRLNDTGVYVNEHLNYRNGEIARQARI